jgi:amidase
MLSQKKLINNNMMCVQKKIYKIDDSEKNALTVKPGEVFEAKVQNAFGKSFKDVKDFEDFLDPKNEEEKKSLNHPCTGPIVVDTDKKNISLAIKIMDVSITNAFQCISRSTGLLKDEFKGKRSCKIYSVKDNKIHFQDDDIIIKTHPKVGCIATIAEGDKRSPGRCTKNGGNIDLNYLDKGSTIYLPIDNDVAKFVIGDLHACQGNGEAAGIAIEADGKVELKVDVVDKIPFPVIDDKHRMIIIGWGDDLEGAAKTATENTIQFLQRIFPICDWSREEVYKFISAEGNIVLGNSTGKVKTCAVMFEKGRITNKYGFSII